MPESFAATFGCLLIAFALDAILYGAAISLVLQYFRMFTRDPRSTRFLVFILALLTTTQISTFFAWIYVDLINRFGNLPALDALPRTALVQLLATYLVAFCSQCYFVTRVWILSQHSIILTGPILILALAQIGAGIAQTTLSGIGGTLSNLANTEIIMTIQSGTSAACNLSITLILCFVLHGSRTGMKTTDNVLGKLMIYTINRGAITSIVALLHMILFLLKPKTLIFMIALIPSNQLYAISVVATLNSRKSMREHMKRSGETSDPIGLPLTSLPGDTLKQQECGVHITRSVVTWSTDTYNVPPNSMRTGMAV